MKLAEVCVDIATRTRASARCWSHVPPITVSAAKATAIVHGTAQPDVPNATTCVRYTRRTSAASTAGPATRTAAATAAASGAAYGRTRAARARAKANRTRAATKSAPAV